MSLAHSLDDGSELDTHLARLLHAQRRIELRVLQQSLAEVRAHRGAGRVTLAGSLVSRGLLTDAEAQAWVFEALGRSGSGETLRRSGSGSGEWDATFRRSGSGSGEWAEPTQRMGRATAKLSVAGWSPGGRVGDYVLRERLGQGGMGVVFLCEHAGTGARYAIKAIREDADEEALARFEQEGQVQAAVDDHPNVVRVRSAGRAGGHLYLVLDLAEGGDLEQRLRLGPLPALEAADLVAQLARGVDHVHARGILHRDLKPANVLFGEGGTPKLVDFGIARLRGGGALTHTGDVLGTPAYMAPEQADGLREHIDARTDVYGLGGILYSALTGCPPFKGKTAIDVLTRVATEQPVRPIALQPDIPRDLEAVCLRAMAKRPEERFASAGELASALEELVARTGETVGSESGGPGAARSRQLSGHLIQAGGGGRNVAALGLAAALVASVLLGLGWWARGLPSAPDDGPPGSESRLPLAASPTPPPDAAPRRAASKRPEIRWELPVGARLVGTLGMELEVGAGGSSYRSEGTSTVAWTVTESTPERLRVAAEITHLRVVQTMLGIPYRYDSSSSAPEDLESPYARAIGGTYRFCIDPRTGEFLEVEGVAAIQSAVWAAVPPDGNRRLYVLPSYTSAARMRSHMNTLFHVLPGPGPDLDQPWTLQERIVFDPTDAEGTYIYLRGTDVTAEQLKGPDVRLLDGIERRFESRRVEGGLNLTWTASVVEQRLDGRATFADGYLKSVRLDRTVNVRGQRGSSRKVVVNITVSLERID